MSTEYRLQLRSHKEVFANREDALSYIEKYFMPSNLVGEPTVYYYGEASQPNVILAIGRGDRTYATIDIGETNERLDEISKEEGDNVNQLTQAVATIKGIIASTGLVLDENKKENQVSYEPDPKDDLIGDSETIADAISVISKYVQENVKSTQLNVLNSRAINLSYQPSENGMTLKATLNISKYGDDDEGAVNDNILGVKSDGLYAAVDLDYDDDKKQLTFVTSGVKNGKFADDAKKKVISIGEHTEYTNDNVGHNVDITVDNDNYTLSADAKISEDPNNILTVQDGKMFVDGRATNIKYNGKNVYQGLNNIEDEISTVNSNIADLSSEIQDVKQNSEISGDTTDTMVITTTKKSVGGYTISGGVRLGPTKSIIVKDGGIEADLEVTCDQLTNTLSVRLGNVTRQIQLPGITLIDNIRYDPASHSIIITWGDGKNFTIPIGDFIINTYTFSNDNSHTVEFHTTDGASNNDKIVMASVKIADDANNLIEVNSDGKLIVDKTKIVDGIENLDDKIDAEIERAKAAEQENKDAIAAEAVRAQAAETGLGTKIDKNTENITTLTSKSEEHGNSIQTISSDLSSFHQTYDAYVEKNDGAVSAVTQKVETNTNDIDAAESNIQQLRSDLDNEISRATTKENTIEKKLEDHLNSTTASIEQDVKDLQTALTSANESISHINDGLTQEISDRKEADTALDGKVSLIDGKVQTLQTDVTALGKDVQANTDALNKEIQDRKDSDTALDGKITTLSGNVSTLSQSVSDVTTRLTSAEQSITKEIQDRKADVESLDTRLKTAESNVGIVQNSLTSLNGKIETETTRATERENAIESKIQTHINEVETDLKQKVNTLSDSVSSMQSAIQSEIARATGEEQRIDSKLTDHIGNSDLQFSTINTSISDLRLADTNFADKISKVESNAASNTTAIDSLATRVTSNETSVGSLNTSMVQANADIANLKSEALRLAVNTNNSDTLTLSASRSDSGTMITGDVKIKPDVSNVITKDGNGIYADVSLSYNKASNLLTLNVNGKAANEIQLSENSLVQDGYYDSGTKSIILTVSKDGGDTTKITIPVGDLVNEWKVDNGTNNPIKLTKETGADGVDVLKATLDISTESHNAILSDNGTLYVSNQAKDLTALWNGDEATIQKVIENLKAETDKVEGINTDVTSLKSDMQTAKTDISNLQQDVADLKSKVETNTTDIAANKGSINTLTSQMTDLTGKVTNLTNSFNDLSKKVDDYNIRITNLEAGLGQAQKDITNINSQINNILQQIGSDPGDKPNIYDRLDAIEEAINQLIDFGKY